MKNPAFSKAGFSFLLDKLLYTTLVTNEFVGWPVTLAFIWHICRLSKSHSAQKRFERAFCPSRQATNAIFFIFCAAAAIKHCICMFASPR